MFSSTITYPGGDLGNIEYAFAQLSNNNIIQIISTSTYTDDLSNFHVIGEVNNTSTEPQTNIIITTILSDTTNNVIVGNHSAFSSIGTIRSGELSPFDILIQDPQILGKFNFMEFTTTSQPGIEKPANLVLNGSSAFFDNVGNPHITGNIINQGQSPEQFLNLAATFYDNSSLGVVGTQSFGLNVANLSNNQMTPFDITITDNKTKSQAKFYSLNMDSTQSSMSPPLNLKFSFDNSGTTNEQFITGGLFTTPSLNGNQGFVIDSDENSGSSGSNGGGHGNGDVLNCEDFDERNFQVGSNDPNNFDGDGDGIGCDSNDNGNSNNGGDLNCGDIDERNFQVGSNDPNNFDGDGDGTGCETDEANDDQTNNNDEEEQEIPLIEPEDTSTEENTNQAIEDSGIGTEEGDTNGNGGNDEEQDTDETASEENNDESEGNENN